MHSPSLRQSAAALALCILVAQPALAEVRVQNSLTNFSYSLQDLRPDDGMAPALYAGNTDTWTSLFDYVYAPGMPFHYYRKTVSTDDTPEAQLISHDDGSRMISAAFSGDRFGRTLDASRADMPNLSGQNLQVVLTESRFHFELAPQSELTFHFRLDLAASSDVPVTGPLAASAGWQAWGFMGPGGETSDYQFQSILLAQGQTEANLERDLTFVFRNTGDTQTWGNFGMRQGVRVDAIGAVPEPSAYGMLLGGLVLLGAASARKGRKDTSRRKPD